MTQDQPSASAAQLPGRSAARSVHQAFLPALAGALALLLFLLPVQPAAAQFDVAAQADYQVVNGHFFTQGSRDSTGKAGFRITDEGGVKFATEFERLGGVAALGYPISRRFVWDGLVVQATQKAVLQWRPETDRAVLLNLLDAFSDAGLDRWLTARQRVPARRPVSADEEGLGREAIARLRLSYLDNYPTLRRAYHLVPDPIAQFGLPTAPIATGSTGRVLRTQRAILVERRAGAFSTGPGQVEVLDVGSLAIEAGLIPAWTAAPVPVGRTVATLPTISAARVDDALLAHLRRLVGRARSAVVQLTDDRTGTGSGVLYDRSGLIVTNYHVVANLDPGRLRVELADGRSFPARVRGGDDWTDLAVVEIKGNDLPALPLGSWQAVRPGDWVVGIGYAPILPGTPSAKAGRVSSVNGYLQVEDDYPHANLIQSNVFLYPGDSGGPLLNLRGEIIGLNTAIRTSRGGQQLSGFSIPATTVRKTVQQLLSPEGIPRPWFGISIRTMTPRLAIQTGHRVTYGIYVPGVTARSPAAAAGLLPGSIIISLNGQPLETLTDLRRQMIRYQVGDKVRIRVVAPTGELRTLDVQLGRRPLLS